MVNNCETCALYKKTPPKTAVGLPLATDLNETVAVALYAARKAFMEAECSERIRRALKK